MNIAILTFEGFNELDSFIASGILNRMKEKNWNVKICSPSSLVTSMNGVKFFAQEDLVFANTADAVLFGSGIFTRDICKDTNILKQLKLNPKKQLLGAQCSGTLLLHTLGFLNKIPVCTDLTTTPWLKDLNADVLNQPFYAKGNIASAGGCMSSQYLATWVLAKLAGKEEAQNAIYYVAPVGEKEETVNRCMRVISEYL